MGGGGEGRMGGGEEENGQPVMDKHVPQTPSHLHNLDDQLLLAS